jgi:ATP-dependent Clp protease ATP-binding subunit ClpB
VILFDEIEKAHPDVFNVLLQILDDGRLTDSQGRVVDFRNTVIIMTSNIGSQFILEAGAQDEEGWARIETAVRDQLRLHFRPEFLNRVDDVIVFRQLDREDIAAIVELQLDRLRLLLEEKRLTLRVTPEARDLLAAEGYDPTFGARPLKRVIQRRLQNAIALEILEGRFHEGDTVEVTRVDGDLRLERAASS